MIRGAKLDSPVVRLPPSRLRSGGSAWRDNRFYLDQTDRDIERMIAHAGLDVGTRFLDLGCGSGRHALGLMRRFRAGIRYLGIDVRHECIDWARRNISAVREDFEFVRIDLPNQRYNPAGAARLDASILGTRSVVNAWSFFTHQTASDALFYMKLVAQALDREGAAHVTALIDDRQARDIAYSEVPLLRVQYTSARWETLVRRAGLVIERCWPAGLPGGQTAFILERAAGGRTSSAS